MLEFFFALISEAILYFFIPKSKLEKNVEILKKEEWFATLEEDYRYNYIIWNNRRVKRFLSKPKNLELLVEHSEAQKEFTDLIKKEHIKYTSFPKHRR